MARNPWNVRIWRPGRLPKPDSEGAARLPVRVWPLSRLGGVEEFGWRGVERLSNPGVATMSNRSRVRKVVRR